MAWVAGVDGCHAGWFRVCRETETGEIAFDLLKTVEEIVKRAPRPVVVALDMPIGLPEAGDRQCDKEARARLGPRRASSVFPVPVRSAIRAATREEASQVTYRMDGRRVGVQTWAIWPRIRQLDDLLARDGRVCHRIREVHPEVSFWCWNGRKPMQHRKKSPEGRCERLDLAARWLGDAILRQGRGAHPKADLADDDILDALACLWTAHRIRNGTAETLPASPPRDATSLAMEIVF